MRKSLSTFLILAIVLIAPMGTMSASRALAQEPVEITMWLGAVSGSTTAECIAENAVDTYNAMGTGTTVEATIQANNWQATQTAVAGGAGPDVVGTPGPSFAMQLALAGRLVPLDEFAEQFGWADRFAEGSLDLGMTNGQLYSIPNEIETLVLYYNKTLFEQNEWQLPTTRDELVALAEEIDAAGIIPFANANAEWRPANEWFVGEFLNHTAGGPQKVYDALTGSVPWTDPDFVDAIEVLNQMQQNGWFAGVLDRRRHLRSWHRSDIFGERQLGAPGTDGGVPRLLLHPGDASAAPGAMWRGSRGSRSRRSGPDRGQPGTG
jgi:ABC-type glycerol-3-phosphate transport system substrate-binding protein